MINYLLLLLFLRHVICDFESTDDFISKIYKIGDKNILFSGNSWRTRYACHAGGWKKTITSAKAEFNKTFGDNLSTLETTNIGIKPFEDFFAFPTCKLIKKDGYKKASVLLAKIDKQVDGAKKIRDQFVTALTQAAQPDTNATLPRLVCYTQQYMKNTLDIYPESEGQRAFIKGYIDLMIVPIVNFWNNKIDKPEEGCQLPPASEKPSKHKSIQIPIFKAAHNLFKKFNY